MLKQFPISCTKPKRPCDLNPCKNGATCEAYANVTRVCRCLPGFSGDSCEIDIDYCQPSTCKNNGTCIDGVGATLSCVCNGSFSGNFCEVYVSRCNPNTCPGFGHCVDNYLTNQVACICQDGFVKDNNGSCVIKEDACNPSQCQHGGNCTKVGDSYTCTCPQGYEGANCQHNINDCDPNPCQNGGNCTDLDPPPQSGDKFICRCPADTSGATCTDSYNICQPSTNPCNANHSSCTDLYRDYTCVCDPGYYGKNCSVSDILCQSYPCRHGGTCVQLSNSYTCQCGRSYTGTNCSTELDHCQPSPCLNGGSCLSYNLGYRCSCLSGYYGNRCETKYSMCDLVNPCVGAGSQCSFTNGTITCSCGPGRNGTFCEIEDIVCSPTSCSNGGTCVVTSSGLTCHCAQGFEGDQCEKRINLCAVTTCPSDPSCNTSLPGPTCLCGGNMMGADCNKVVSHEFDVLVMPELTYQDTDYQQLVQPINSSALSCSVWVRYTRAVTPGVILSLYGLGPESNFSDSTDLLRLEVNQAVLGFGGTRVLSYNKTLNDGVWHHVGLSWSKSTGTVVLYVDGQLVAEISSYAKDQPINTFCWLVLGGVYSKTSNTLDHTNGMTGRLSRVFVVDQALTAAELVELYTNKTAVPKGVLFGFTVAMAMGTAAPVDFNSELTSGLCLTASSCKSLNQSFPKFISCPKDQMLISERVSSPTWTTPVAPPSNGSTSELTTLVSGETQMEWGAYAATYAMFDLQGSTDLCSFKIFNRRKPCLRPVTEPNQMQVCVQVNNSLRCTVECNSGLKLSAEAPRYYSCGTSGMFDSLERILRFEYPSCSVCSPPLKDYIIQVFYYFYNTSVCSSLPQQILTSLVDLQAVWPGVCGSNPCQNTIVTVDCTQAYGGHVTWKLTSVSSPLKKFDGPLTQDVEQLITAAFVDDGSFTYSGQATPDVQSLVISPVSSCLNGTVLIGNCCAECGLGYYYDTDRKMCVACPRGSYLGSTGTTGTAEDNRCQSCPAGTTTSHVGTHSQADCYNFCPEGNFYNETLGDCQSCPSGFYSSSGGQLFCDACSYTSSTTGSSGDVRAACSENPTTTQVTYPTTTQVTSLPDALPAVGASTAEDPVLFKLLIVLVCLLILILLVGLVLFFCFREWLERTCTCLRSNKVVPDGPTPWYYVNKYGETKIKFVTYKMRDVISNCADRVVSLSDEGYHQFDRVIPLLDDSPQPVKLAVLSEQSSGNTFRRRNVPDSKMVEADEGKLKSLPEEPAVTNVVQLEPQNDLLTSKAESMPVALPPLKTSNRALTVPEGNTSAIKRPPSAFRKPKPSLLQVPYDAFLQPGNKQNLT
ncbi:uncharacterized protein LOC131953095 [Physella acuta]|uniref:uncharacterized protein LOC131953095 n=1 Tax=Physella acuta TaxID=109671 RepID=UPI0027DCF3D1|nr:uncharacterized protein LOC131953095 [Physella acuta]